MTDRPDIVLLATEWQPRALVRAQLIECGFDVVAVDSWPMMRASLRPGSKPRLAVVDLQGLPAPDQVLNDLRTLMEPERVIVLCALGTPTAAEVSRLGFHVVKRPVSISELVASIAHAIQNSE